jgi:hypothetical protein
METISLIGNCDFTFWVVTKQISLVLIFFCSRNGRIFEIILDYYRTGSGKFESSDFWEWLTILFVLRLDLYSAGYFRRHCEERIQVLWTRIPRTGMPRECALHNHTNASIQSEVRMFLFLI